jgi:hypothetical protein
MKRITTQMAAMPIKISRYGVGVGWWKIVVLIKYQRAIPHATATTNHVMILFFVILNTVRSNQSSSLDGKS